MSGGGFGKGSSCSVQEGNYLGLRWSPCFEEDWGSAAQFKLAHKRPFESLASYEWLQNMHLISVTQHAP